jgi:hypothetical protein
MFLPDTPPDTSAYMVAGYAIFFVIALIYLVSLFARSRNLALDLATLESLEAEAKESAIPATPLKPGAAKQRTTKAKGPRPKKVVKKLKAKK